MKEAPELTSGNFCYLCDESNNVVDGEIVPDLIVRDDPGRYPMMGNGAFAAPWKWGKLETAQLCAAKSNNDLGLSKADVTAIVESSIVASIRSHARKH